MLEYLPILEVENNIIKVLSKIERKQAHGPNPVCHGTCIIVPIRSDGKILFANKTEKKKLKGRNVKEGVRVFDVPGGHLDYEDISADELVNGLTQKGFLKCAKRELSEELLIIKEDGSLQGVQAKDDELILIGQYGIRNNHNYEISMIYLYKLKDGIQYTSMDSLNLNGQLIQLKQNVSYFSLQEVKENIAKPESSLYFDDALGRMLQADNGDKLEQLINEMIA